MTVTVNEFVRKTVLPQHQPIVRLMRQPMREPAPDAEEAFRFGMPARNGTRIGAWIIPAEKHISFDFSRRAEFRDEYGMLRGAGKSARHLKLKSVKDVDKTVLSYYVKQALDLGVSWGGRRAGGRVATSVAGRSAWR